MSEAEKDKALNEIENAIERWLNGRSNDDDTIELIREILIRSGRLNWEKSHERNQSNI